MGHLKEISWKKSVISDWIKFSRQSCLALFSVWASTHLDYTADWPLSVSSSRLCSCSMLEFADFSVFLFPLPLNSLCLESLLPGKQFPCLDTCPMPLNIWSCKSTCYFSDLIDFAFWLLRGTKPLFVSQEVLFRALFLRGFIPLSEISTGVSVQCELTCLGNEPGKTLAVFGLLVDSFKPEWLSSNIPGSHAFQVGPGDPLCHRSQPQHKSSWSNCMQKNSPFTWLLYWKLPIDTDFIHFICQFHQSCGVNAREVFIQVHLSKACWESWLSDDQPHSDYNVQWQRALCMVAVQESSRPNPQRNKE